MSAVHREDEVSGGSSGGGAESPRRRALAWLHERLDDIHPELAAAVRRCVREGSEPDAGSSVADVLADAAAAELQRIAAGPQDRAAAVRLLAADAVLTFAFEAVAAQGGDSDALADRVGLRGTLGHALLEALNSGEGTA